MVNLKKNLLISVLITVFLSVIFANNRYTGSDPRGTLILSQAMITHGTVKLDRYGAETLKQFGYPFYTKGQHTYYYFPIGTSIASIPFVAIANGVGLDMLYSESPVQIIIASITSVVTLLFLYKLAALFLTNNNALMVSSVFWFGTSFSSTAGTALWSHNFATLFALVAIYSSLKAAKKNEDQRWCLIACLLFAAYLCRPTMALLAPFCILFIFTYSKRSAIKVGFFLFLLLCTFSIFSLYEFGQYLPDYYLPKRLSGGQFFEAFYGNLFSPARGLFIYSPFIIAVCLCLKYSSKSWRLKKSWLLIGLAWPILHLLFISRFPHWWAGGSYGARFMTDVLPGLFVAVVFSWPTNLKLKVARVLAGILLLSCVYSVMVNTGQGLFNKYTAMWNAVPNIDKNPEFLFDWSYPQFLANKAGHESRLLQHASKDLQPITLGEPKSHKAKDVIFLGWSVAEPTHRWSEGKYSRIIFKIDAIKQFEGVLQFHMATYGKQTIIISINDTMIFSGAIESWDKILQVSFDKTLLRDVEGENTISFELPDAHLPTNGDGRMIALAIKSFQIN